jgi:hypothetical chaperone protein
MSAFCGLDFGTSNSTIGTFINNACQLVALDGHRAPMRSAIFCDSENKQWVFGQEGINRYLESVPGRLLMSLKSVLGSSLMGDETLIFNEFISYEDILGHFIKYIKQEAERQANHELTQVVLGRPVHFDDKDPVKDRYAQDTLENIARRLGFKDVSFQFEPIAAALAYETTIATEQIALIVDMGGGTSDFTVIRLRPGSVSSDRSQDVLANSGIHIAGTDFDKRISLDCVMPLLGMGSLMRGSSSDIEVPSVYYHDLTTWHTLANLYSAKTITHVRSIQAAAQEKQLLGRLLQVLKTRAGHHILDVIETSKQQLSEVLTVSANLDFIESDLSVLVTRKVLNEVIDADVQRIVDTILHSIQLANIKTTDISAIFYTGGSTKIPYIRDKINPLFPHADVIQGDAFGSVGMGLTIDAARKYA